MRDGEDVSTPELIRRLAAALGCPARLFPFPPGLLRLAGALTGRTAAVDRSLWPRGLKRPQIGTRAGHAPSGLRVIVSEAAGFMPPENNEYLLYIR